MELFESVYSTISSNPNPNLTLTRPARQMKGPATAKCCRFLCSWHRFYLRFLLQLRVYTPVARCSPFLHGVMPEVIIISQNLHKTKGKKMSSVWTWKIPPASEHTCANMQGKVIIQLDIPFSPHIQLKQSDSLWMEFYCWKWLYHSGTLGTLA